MEFSGLFDLVVNSAKENIIMSLEYFVFIRFDDKLYIDIKEIGSIIMPFDDLEKYESLKIYYELSQLLTNRKSLVVEIAGYAHGDYKIPTLEKERSWFIDCVYLLEDYEANSKSISTGNYYPYLYNCNPYNLRDTEVSADVDIEGFYKIFNDMYGFNNGYFEKRLTEYTNRVIEYNINLIDEGLNEITSSRGFEDAKNIGILLELYKADGMNNDILHMIYENTISLNGRREYDPFILALLSH